MSNKLFLASVKAYEEKDSGVYKYYMILTATSYVDATKKIEQEHYPKIEDIISIDIEMIGDETNDETYTFFNKDIYHELKG